MGHEVALVQETPPILLLDIEGIVTASDMLAHLDSIEECLHKHDLISAVIYLMVDVQKADMSFGEVIRGAQTHATARRGSSNDPLTIPMFVGTNPMILLLADLFKSKIPLFHTREQALEFVRVHAATKQ